jgi:Leucine-rich repeat (LRR) protein
MSEEIEIKLTNNEKNLSIAGKDLTELPKNLFNFSEKIQSLDLSYNEFM